MADTVKTIKSSGGDYSSLAGWEAGQQKTISAGDRELAEYYSFDDTTFCTIDGWTTVETGYILVYTPASERHDGKWNVAKARNTGGIIISEEYVRLDGLQFDTGASRSIIISVSAGTGEIRISNLFSTNTFRSIDIYSVGALTIKVWNAVLYVSGGGQYGAILLNDADATLYCYNVTAYHAGGYLAFYQTAGSMNLVNCLGVSGIAQAFYGTMASVTYCASNDATADDWSGAGNRINQTFTFVDSANGDFHLASTDAGARDYGVSDPGSGLFSDDIDGVARSGSWDIGADEYVAAGGGLSISAARSYTQAVNRAAVY